MSTARRPSRSRVNPSFSGSLPGYPDRSDDYLEDDDAVPLPDHFPDPIVDPGFAERIRRRSSVTLEKGATLVLNQPPKSVVTSSSTDTHDGAEVRDEAKEGVKRITDKYAAPGTLLRNGSVSSSRAVTPKETLPASPTPSITVTRSPFFSPSHSTFPALNSPQAPDSADVPSARNSKLSTASSSSATIQPDLNSLCNMAVVPASGTGQRLGPLSASAFSDASSDISDTSFSPSLRNSVFTSSVSGGNGLVGTSRYQSVSGIPLTASLGDGVTEQDVQQVEMFYRSHKSEVTVCHCLANLYLGSAASKTTSVTAPKQVDGSGSSATYSDLWEFVTTGIPLVVQDSGDHHRCRRVTIVLAEKGTGFVLWKDAVTPVSHYSCPDSNFHTLVLSTDSNKLVGLSYDDSKAAAEFAAHITKLTADFDSDSGTLTKKGKRKKKKQDSKKKLKYKPPKKMDISVPCYFQHVTKLERPQVTGVMPLPPNSFSAVHNTSVSGLSDIFRDRLSVASVSRTHSHCSDLSEACSVVSDRSHTPTMTSDRSHTPTMTSDR